MAQARCRSTFDPPHRGRPRATWSPGAFRAPECRRSRALPAPRRCYLPGHPGSGESGRGRSRPGTVRHQCDAWRRAFAPARPRLVAIRLPRRRAPRWFGRPRRGAGEATDACTGSHGSPPTACRVLGRSRFVNWRTTAPPPRARAEARWRLRCVRLARGSYCHCRHSVGAMQARPSGIDRSRRALSETGGSGTDAVFGIPRSGLVSRDNHVAFAAVFCEQLGETSGSRHTRALYTQPMPLLRETSRRRGAGLAVAATEAMLFGTLCAVIALLSSRLGGPRAAAWTHRSSRRGGIHPGGRRAAQVRAVPLAGVVASSRSSSNPPATPASSCGRSGRSSTSRAHTSSEASRFSRVVIGL